MIDGALERLPLRHEQEEREPARPLPLLGSLQAAGWMPLVTLLAGIISLIYLITTSSVMGTGYNIQRLEREREEWLARNAQLELELAKVRSLAWVEAQATTRMGMVKGEKPIYVPVPGAPGADSRGDLSSGSPTTSPERLSASTGP